MAKTLKDIEQLVRTYTNKKDIVLALSPGIDDLNSLYRKIAIMHKWPELRRIVTSFSLLTSTTTGIYPWIGDSVMDGGIATTTSFAFAADGGTATTSVFVLSADGGNAFILRFYDVVNIEVETTATSNIFNSMLSVPNESEWNQTGKDSAGIPVYYVRRKTDTNVMEVRPVPSYSGGLFKITGYVEPDPLTNLNSTTDFLISAVDDVLARFISAVWFRRSGDFTKAERQDKLGLTVLSRIIDRDVTIQELRR